MPRLGPAPLRGLLFLQVPALDAKPSFVGQRRIRFGGLRQGGFAELVMGVAAARQMRAVSGNLEWRSYFFKPPAQYGCVISPHFSPACCLAGLLFCAPRYLNQIDLDHCYFRIVPASMPAFEMAS
jgi:hypothetical protein